MIKITNCDLIHIGGDMYAVTDGKLTIELKISGPLTDAVKKDIALRFEKSKKRVSETLKRKGDA